MYWEYYSEEKHTEICAATKNTKNNEKPSRRVRVA
jgi:hypothetical protein